MGFSFCILRVISCKMVISVRVFQRGILWLSECTPTHTPPLPDRGFCAGWAKAHPWAVIGASLGPAVLWGFCTGLFMGSWGWRQPDVTSSISSAHLPPAPCLVPEPFKVLGGRKHTSGTDPLQPQSSGVRRWTGAL